MNAFSSAYLGTWLSERGQENPVLESVFILFFYIQYILYGHFIRNMQIQLKCLRQGSNQNVERKVVSQRLICGMPESVPPGFRDFAITEMRNEHRFGPGCDV